MDQAHNAGMSEQDYWKVQRSVVKESCGVAPNWWQERGTQSLLTSLASAGLKIVLST